MPQSISEQLDEVFHRASETFVRGLLKTEQDRIDFDAIGGAARDKQAELTRLYHEQYDARVDDVRKRLLDEAAHWRLTHPSPPGGDVDRAGEINRAAHRTVQTAHEADLQRTRDEAQNAFEGLLERAYHRNQVRGLAVEAFRAASDRRSGEDRRTPRYAPD